jgi:type VI secretion system secreted protein VgrG
MINGGGSYVKITAEGIEYGTQGHWEVHASSHTHAGPRNMAVPVMPARSLKNFPNWIAISHRDPEGTPMAGQKYRIYFEGGTIISGTLDAKGKAHHDNVPEKAERVEYEPRELKPDEPWPSWQKMIDAAKGAGQ